MFKEERVVLGVGTSDEYCTEKFDQVDDDQKMTAVLGDRWSQKATQKGVKIGKYLFYVKYGKNKWSAQLLEMSFLGVGAVLRLEKDARLTVVSLASNQ